MTDPIQSKSQIVIPSISLFLASAYSYGATSLMKLKKGLVRAWFVHAVYRNESVVRAVTCQSL